MIEVRSVLCPVDFTPISQRNVRMAVEMCKRIGSRLVLLHNRSARPPGFLSVSWMWSEDHEREEAEKEAAVPAELDKLCAAIPEGVRYEARLSRGPIDAALLLAARELPADLIVMGTHGPTSGDHESLTERIVLQAPCSVLTIGEAYVPETVFDAEPRLDPGRAPFLVPVDFTPRSRALLDFVFDLAPSMPHGLVLLHAVRAPHGGRRELEEARERLARLVPEDLAGRTEVRVETGAAVEAIVRVAGEIGALCVVMAAHRSGMLRRLLFGTTTLGVLHGSRSPVWFVPDRSAAA